MIVSNTASLLWNEIPADALQRVSALFDARPGATVFFRADDVAIPSARQDLLLELFVRNQAPLCAAMIPAWLSGKRWARIDGQVAGNHRLFAWHQHGWNHINHETQGKKQEFGPSLGSRDKQRAILRGRDKLAGILGDRFLPVFTPPWNRVDAEAMAMLRDAGFRAISRYSAAKVPALEGLPDLFANVDLHTRKEPDAASGWEALLHEFEQALAGGRVGIMIHHQRMNGPAFAFLDGLLGMLRARTDLRLVHFGHLLEDLS